MILHTTQSIPTANISISNINFAIILQDKYLSTPFDFWDAYRQKTSPRRVCNRRQGVKQA